MLVAAHDWDVAGAVAAGAQGAFLHRFGGSYRSWLPTPDVEGSLASIGDWIVSAHP
jgi:2-haloacid dehalogenase